MFYYISGTLVHKTDSYAVIEAGGVGYRINSTKPSLDALGDIGSQARLYTCLHIRNASDQLALYGFATREERSLFEMITSVSGVGAKTAQALLSNVSPSKFALCVVTGDSKYLSKNTAGLGPKGAQRLILELKDKFKGVDLEGLPQDTVTQSGGVMTGDNDAVAALVTLGYTAEEARKATAGAEGDTEEIIKIGLKNLARG